MAGLGGFALFLVLFGWSLDVAVAQTVQGCSIPISIHGKCITPNSYLILEIAAGLQIVSDKPRDKLPR
jgi:hypothetical protein